MSYTYINPKYIEPGQEADAVEFDRILEETLPSWAADMSGGYAWECELPLRGDFQNEADALAAHLIREFES